MAKEYRFSLGISQQEYLKYYSGAATTVQVRSQEGLVLRFPASALTNHLAQDGIRGNFVIKLDENNKLIELLRIK